MAFLPLLGRNENEDRVWDMSTFLNREGVDKTFSASSHKDEYMKLQRNSLIVKHVIKTVQIKIT